MLILLISFWWMSTILKSCFCIYLFFIIIFIFKLNSDEEITEAIKRDYKTEYKKYGSSTKSKKYRAELNQYNRKKGTYGNGDGKDASHKGGKIVGFEKESANRGRAEKSRLKKEFVSINEANIIQKIDKLAKANKYGTVDGTRMNGKTAKEIMAIFMHPKMNSYRRQMMGMKSHELADLTVSLVKPLKIKVESVNEKISKEEWAQYPKYARKLKPYMQKLLKVPLKVRVIKQAGPNPWIEIRVAKFGKDIIPNDFRVKAAKAIGASNVRDWDNVNYGNIRVNSISLKHDIWVKLLGNKVKV